MAVMFAVTTVFAMVVVLMVAVVLIAVVVATLLWISRGRGGIGLGWVSRGRGRINGCGHWARGLRGRRGGLAVVVAANHCASRAAHGGPDDGPGLPTHGIANHRASCAADHAADHGAAVNGLDIQTGRQQRAKNQGMFHVLLLNKVG